MRENERLQGAMRAINGPCEAPIDHAGMQAQNACAQGMCAEEAPRIRTTVEVRADSHFDRAFGAAKDGLRIARAGWNGSGQWVEVQYPDKNSRMSLPYCVLRTAQGHFVPWVPSQGDLFARDWAILPRT